MNCDFSRVGLHVPAVLLPEQTADFYKWAVVACDQYTSQPEYWEEVARIVGDAPSTLHLIFPEVFLGKGDENGRISKIQQNMKAYQDEKILIPQRPGFIYLDRQTSRAASRKGLIVALDLECYDYHKGSQTLVRATEGTVLERIPPRVKIREGAAIEIPHIMVLIDDPEDQVFGPLAANIDRMTRVYDTDLMMDGGHVTGYRVDAPDLMESVCRGLHHLADANVFAKKYHVSDRPLLLYAVGDGNHSLATAKAVWEGIKAQAGSADAVQNHPARYALVELVNVHDPGLEFEPIHRVIFGVKHDEFKEAMRRYFTANGMEIIRRDPKADILSQRSPEKNFSEDYQNNAQIIEFISGTESGFIVVKQPAYNLAVGSLQAFLDDYLSQNPNVGIDYIHGRAVITELGQKPGNIGFYLLSMPKEDLFKTVILDGVLPRKTFSMGEAEEKRFYMECRKIIF